jgi:hypothetical protein
MPVQSEEEEDWERDVRTMAPQQTSLPTSLPGQSSTVLALAGMGLYLFA